jgi:hypothetical protein
MFVIESARSDGKRWISGAFLHRENALVAVEAMALKPGTHVIQEVAHLTFPFFIIERQGFEYCTPVQAQAALNAIRSSGNPDHVHLNLYCVAAEYTPEVPGRDEMGRLQHWHISDRELLEPRSSDPWAMLAAVTGDA